MEFNKINNLLGPAVLLKNGLKFKANLEVLTIQVNQ